MSGRVRVARDRLLEAAEELRAATAGADDDALLETLQACTAATRRLDHIGVETTATVQRRGVFTERGYRSTATALADLLRCDRRHARRQAVVAAEVCTRTGLDGATLPPRLQATATVFASGEIGIDHAEVVADLLGSRPAERLDPDTWAAAEVQLAEQATTCTPSELRTWGTQLVEMLDQDGPEPDERPDPEINELRIVRHRNRPGGTIRARFDDAERFDAIATAIDAHAAPRSADEQRTPPERQADALAEICEHALEHAPTSLLPHTGGRRPVVSVLIRLDDLQGRVRAATLDFGGPLTPASLRMLACDAGIVPIVLNGAGQPLDVGRLTRTVPDGLRRAVTARDRGCAHPGCGRPPSWCEIHHVIPWEHGGPTELGNLVMLCRIHHRLIHHSGWTVRFRDGLPEFVPPKWIDPRQRPRAKPTPGTAPTAPRPSEDDLPYSERQFPIADLSALGV